jgi:hypothetical protein
MRLGRGFEGQPLLVPTLYKTLLFTVCVAVFDIVEGLARGLIGGLGPMGAVDELMGRFGYEWLARARDLLRLHPVLCGQRAEESAGGRSDRHLSAAGMSRSGVKLVLDPGVSTLA